MFHIGSAIQPTDSNRRPFARQSQMSEENSSEGNLRDRLQRQSTKTSQLPDRPSIKSVSGSNRVSDIYRPASIKSVGNNVKL